MSRDSKPFAAQLSKTVVQLRNKLDLERQTMEAVEQYVTLYIATALVRECELLSDSDKIVSSYYTLHVKPYVMDVVSQINEHTVIKVDAILELTKRLYMERYNVACGRISVSVLSAWLGGDTVPNLFVPNGCEPHKFVDHLSSLTSSNNTIPVDGGKSGGDCPV